MACRGEPEFRTRLDSPEIFGKGKRHTREDVFPSQLDLRSCGSSPFDETSVRQILNGMILDALSKPRSDDRQMILARGGKPDYGLISSTTRKPMSVSLRAG